MRPPLSSQKAGSAAGADDGGKLSRAGPVSGRMRLSLGRGTTSAQGFLPSREDMAQAVRLLEVPGTGQVREAQVKMLIDLSFRERSVPEPLRRFGEGTGSDSSSGGSGGGSAGGRLELGDVVVAIEEGFAESQRSASLQHNAGSAPPSLARNEAAAETGKDDVAGMKRVGSSESVAKTASIAGGTNSNSSRSLGRKTPVHSKRGQGGFRFDNLSEYVEAFVRFDHDKDGVISPSDLKRAVDASSVGGPLLKDCEEAVRRVDCQQIGAVTLLEFGHLMEQVDKFWAAGDDDLL